MVEIEGCRKCGHCCHPCIFLDYNNETDLFTCLIYNNKFRTIVRLLDYNERKRDDVYPFPLIETHEGIGFPSDRILRDLFCIVYDENIRSPQRVCDTWNCYKIPRRKKREHQFLVESTKLIMKQRYEVIHNFDELVGILNA